MKLIIMISISILIFNKIFSFSLKMQRSKNINIWGQQNCSKSKYEETYDPNFPLAEREIRYFAKQNINCDIKEDGTCPKGCYRSISPHHQGCLSRCKGCYFVTNIDNGIFPRIKGWKKDKFDWYIAAEGFKTSINAQAGRYLIDENICKSTK